MISRHLLALLCAALFLVSMTTVPTIRAASLGASEDPIVDAEQDLGSGEDDEPDTPVEDQPTTASGGGDNDVEACIGACADLYDPVCVSGLTLASPCHATCMGLTNWETGVCQDAPPALSCTTADCQTCAFQTTAEGVEAEDPLRCEQCRSGKYLHEGICLDVCPSGHNHNGAGNYGRTCEPFKCGDEFCHSCDEATNTCNFCNSAKYLLDGACVDSCPEGFVAEGSGTFARTCRQATCKELDANCNACDQTDISVCVQCGNAKYLTSDGQCVDTCPDSQTGLGFGTFGRTCSACTAFCHSCNEDTGVCDFCNNAKYLFENSCLDSCPESTLPVGTGNFKRVCEPEPACGANCEKCDDSTGTCTMCRNRTYLLDGACVASCPAPLREQGTGFWSRKCVD